ncbi:MAG TPA: hypothetical protein VMV18_01740 [bacterium]|nr:hypothetical protein [bacterium]
MSTDNTVFLVPTTNLGHIEDVMPERIHSGTNEWIEHSRDLLDKKRKAARDGKWIATHPVGETMPHLKPFSADACPAMGELNSIGYLLKWPATALLRQVAPKGWQLKPSTNYNFYSYSPLTSFAEMGEAEAILVETGWIVVTPPGWSILFKNIPNNLSGSPRGITFAEGVVRTDQATIPLATHAFLRNAPKEIKLKRGDPMAVIFPFRREPFDLVIADRPEHVEEAARIAGLDKATFTNTAGGYRKLYVEDENPSALWPTLRDWHRKNAG